MSELARRYEVAGRAVYRWVDEVADTILEELPPDLRDSSTATVLQRTREEVTRGYYAARELWNEGRKAEAANKMAQLLRVVTNMTSAIETAARASAGYRTVLALPGVSSALAFVRSSKRTLDEMLGGAGEMLEGLGTGAALLGVGLLLLAVLR